MIRVQARVKPFPHLARQRGQAMVYGLFMLMFGVAALFFMFNTGQTTAEKTKLVNTADAVAYSAAVMHARALNFDAYTNRALVANEMTIAQMVSLTSWVKYAKQHGQRVTPLYCLTYYAVPVWTGVLKYEVLCAALTTGVASAIVEEAESVISQIAKAAVVASEVAKMSLQAAQTTMFVTFLPARTRVMKEVAEANYLNDGAIKVDPVPFTDDFMLLDGTGPVIARYSGDDRVRMRDVEQVAMKKDDFMGDRTWSDTAPLPCALGPRGKAQHSASTTMLGSKGLDGWAASDSADLRVEAIRFKWGIPRCKTIASYPLGSGQQRARTNPSGQDWKSTGVPNFYELSKAALKYTPANPDEKKRDLRLKFAIRLTRAKDQQRTSAGSSAVKPSGRLNLFEGNQAKNVMAAVATSEVFFERIDGKKEYGSLFNPYWQAHLIGNSEAVKIAAAALQEN